MFSKGFFIGGSAGDSAYFLSALRFNDANLCNCISEFLKAGFTVYFFLRYGNDCSVFASRLWKFLRRLMVDFNLVFYGEREEFVSPLRFDLGPRLIACIFLISFKDLIESLLGDFLSRYEAGVGLKFGDSNSSEPRNGDDSGLPRC